MRYQYYTAIKLFRFLLAVGFVINLAFIIPGLFAPRRLEMLIQVGPTNTVYWLQNVSLLLLIVTTMYLPAIKDPFRYLFVSYLAVAGRFSAGILFTAGVLFMNYPRGMRILAGSDLILSTIQALVLWRMLAAGDPRQAYNYGADR